MMVVNGGVRARSTQEPSSMPIVNPGRRTQHCLPCSMYKE